MGSIKILLADDSITIRKVVDIIFGGDDYSLTMVDNGAAVIEKALQIRPDILLIDVIMPGMNGYEVCEAVRREPLLAATPILLLTGSFDHFDEEKARQCGANDHIIKPFEAQQLVSKVQELLAQAGESAARTLQSESTQQEAAFESTFAGAAPAVAFPSAFSVPEPKPAETSVFESTFKQTSAASPDDPWGAFTEQPETATPSVADESPFESHFAEQTPETPAAAPFESSFDIPDVMEMLQEDSIPPAAAAAEPETIIGSTWIPTDEQTFEFSKETAGSPPCAPVAAPITLSEEQLKAAIMAASKETIERIVWEVVPDLAETLIREAIRKITDGK